MTTLTHLRTPRPHRADAARNYDAVLTAAAQIFGEQGADASLDEVARQAGVGIATLYRNFPTREVLIENVYISEVEAVCAFAETAVGVPRAALFAWLHRFVEYIGAKAPLAAGLNRESDAYKECRRALYAAGQPLLDRAQKDDDIRPDVTIDDVLRLANAIASSDTPTPAQRNHLLNIVLDGLTAHP